MKFSVFALLICLTNSVFCQDTTSYREYNKGPLKWSDFKAEPITELDIEGQHYTSRSIQFNKNDSIPEGLVMYMYNVYTAKHSSWYNPESQNPKSLYYFQNTFDISEYFERLKEREINLTISASRKTKGFQDTIQNIINKHNRAEEIMSHQFKKAWISNNDSLINGWTNKIKEQLDSLPRVTEFEYERTNNTIGTYLSGGYQTNEKNYDQYLGNQIEYFGVGFNFKYKKWLFDYKASIGGSKAKLDYTSPSFSFNKGKQIFYGNFDFLLGRELLNYNRFSFSPFIGGKLSQLNYNDDSGPIEGPFGYGYFGGVQLEYQLIEKPENIFSGVDFVIFYRGQYTQMHNILDNLNANQISHSLGLSFNIFTLKVTEFR